MERLWTPWRFAYVTGAGAEESACVLCDAADPFDEGHRDLVVFRGQWAYVILNRYPYNNGHLMVVTNRHVPSLHAATPEELSDVMNLTRYAEMALNEGYRPHGINVGINLGRPA